MECFALILVILIFAPIVFAGSQIEDDEFHVS